MDFENTLKEFQGYDFNAFFRQVSDADIPRAISKDRLDIFDFLILLSQRAEGHLEAMARKSQELTLNNFGKVIYLYAPLYLANYCDNECLYCGFNRAHSIERKKLSFEEVESEANVIRRTGIRHIIILTGESREHTPVSYLKECALVLKKYFSSISIEVYPLEVLEYRELIEAGVDGLTLYQETYDRALYARLHRKGPKSDFTYRLSAPDKACSVKMRSLSIGALLGLSDFRLDAFFVGLHAAYLERAYPDVELSVSLPRLQRAVGDFAPICRVSDQDLVQVMLALRIFLPRVGINISTRESQEFRSNLIGLGVTRMSAGSRTEVGGYGSVEKTQGQFDVADTSGVEEVKEMISSKGYQPVMKDWQAL